MQGLEGDAAELGWMGELRQALPAWVGSVIFNLSLR